MPFKYINPVAFRGVKMCDNSFVVAIHNSKLTAATHVPASKTRAAKLLPHKHREYDYEKVCSESKQLYALKCC